jgi:hypothetical protein
MTATPYSYGDVFAKLIAEQQREDAQRKPDLRTIPNAFANCADAADVEALLAALTLERQP